MVRKEKREEVRKLKELIDEYPVIGVVDMFKLPSTELQKMRKDLHGKAKIKMSKKILMKFALEKSKKDIEKLEDYFKNQPAFIFTSMNPFKLYKYLAKNKVESYAKPGDIAQKDIVVPSGSTGLDPGPVIGKLQSIGLSTSVKEGKVSVERDSVVAEEGEEITLELANALNTLDIKPMEIGLDLIAAYEDGKIFEKEILSVDEQEYIEEIKSCTQKALNLSVNISFPTELSKEVLIQKAWIRARSLSLESEIYTKEFIEEIIIKSKKEGLTLNNFIES